MTAIYGLWQNSVTITGANLRILATGKDGEQFEITDLYWFEENGVHDFDGETNFGEKYMFAFILEEKRA